ncbi:hypothetical protein HYD55_03865 [Mycoplasmopsis bovis]|nr:hypothetical protein [Mycoplasmopsis bovis]QQH71691.1 hypothetical protein HYD55_03865 [Mycoplasmopsis bovis]
MNPRKNQTESDEEPKKAEKAYRETMNILKTKWVHKENKVQQTLVLVEVKIIVEVRMMNKEK